MKKKLIYDIENLQEHIAFLSIAEKNNIYLDTMFCYYGEIINYLENKSEFKIQNLLSVITENVFKLDYKNNIYHTEIKNDILNMNRKIRNNLNVF